MSGTPGPWFSRRTGEIVDQSGNVVAHVMRFADMPKISAAPELVNALEHIAGSCEGRAAEMARAALDAIKLP